MMMMMMMMTTTMILVVMMTVVMVVMVVAITMTLASTDVELKRAEDIRMLIEGANHWPNGEQVDLETALILFLEGMRLEGVQGLIEGVQGISFGPVSKAKTIEFIVLVMVFRPSHCHISDISHKVAASTHMYMNRSMMRYKRGLGLGLIQNNMIQKPMLRVEVYTRALRASQNVKIIIRCVPFVFALPKRVHGRVL